MIAQHLSHVKIEAMSILRTPDLERPYHHGDLRASLLDAAESLLDAAPARALTMRDVARAAGVSHAAPYHHFESLERLLAALAARGLADLAAAMEGASRCDSPHEAMVAICETYVAFACARPGRFRLMFGPLFARKAQFPELLHAAEDAFHVLMRCATAFAPEGGPALALTGWSVAHGLANLVIDGALQDLPIEPPPVDQIARMIALQVLG